MHMQAMGVEHIEFIPCKQPPDQGEYYRVLVSYSKYGAKCEYEFV